MVLLQQHKVKERMGLAYVSVADHDYELPIFKPQPLIYFDLTPIREMSQSTLDITSSTFRCHLKLSDVYAGQTTPSNFSLIVYPLSQSFDEGVGRDVVRFEDVDVTGLVYGTSAGIAGTTSALPTATDDNKCFKFEIDLRGRKRYLDLVATCGDGATGTFATASSG